MSCSIDLLRREGGRERDEGGGGRGREGGREGEEERGRERREDVLAMHVWNYAYSYYCV